MKIFVDTNIFLRFLLADHPRQSPACKKLFEKAAKGEVKLVTLPIVIAEIAWVLHSFYKEPFKEVAEKLRVILLFEGLDVSNRDALLLATQVFESKKIDFIDAYIASWIKSKNLAKVFSYDKDFDKIKEIKRIEP